MEDDRKLCEYSLPEGATISALFEPDVDINIEFSTNHQSQKLTVSNATSVMALKVQIFGVMRCGAGPEKLEIRLGDMTLEDLMPLHFFGITDGSQLQVVKPYVRVRVENNHGNLICWRLDRKDTIKEVKAELATSLGNVSTKQMHLYIVSDGKNFEEIDDDDETVEHFKIQDGDKLYLLTYRWVRNEYDVTVKKTGLKLSGLEKDDSCLAVKVKAQDQMGMPVNTMKVARFPENQWTINCTKTGYFLTTRVQKYNQLIEISDEQLPFNYKEPLSVVTEEELKADPARVEEEKKAWLEELRRQGYRV